MKASRIKQCFSETFGSVPELSCFSPGRVNLIGEHIDYNGGRVMPVAIDLGTCFSGSRNRSNAIRIFSERFDEQLHIELQDLAGLPASGSWADYLVGMLQQLERIHGKLPGTDWLIGSDLPQNSGLSSSASFCLGFGFAMSKLLGFELDKVNLARLAQIVENDFVGVSCGIMDPFAVAMGKSGHCMVLDCDSLEHEYLPLNAEAIEIVIVNSGVPRKLAESGYNARRQECEQALQILQTGFQISRLCELNPAQVESCSALRHQPVLYRRARHVSSENQRVHRSVTALKCGRLSEFGQLMNASHDSLQRDFDVSCRELDLLVDTAQSVPGVLGSRMTGAGFGGCTVSLVESGSVPLLTEQVRKIYSEKTPYQAEIYSVKPGDGVCVIA